MIANSLNSQKFNFYSCTLRCALLFNELHKVTCKGIAVIGASGGGNEVCADCGGNYTDEELEVSLFILMGIMCLFFIILCCQCFSRILHHCRHDDSTNYPYPEKYKSLPPPPYVRSVNGV